MRCLNCNTVIAESDVSCYSCGAQCTAPVREQQRGLPVPYIGLTLMLVGMFGYVFLNRPVTLAMLKEHKMIALACGLAGFFVGLFIDAFLWWHRDKKR